MASFARSSSLIRGPFPRRFAVFGIIAWFVERVQATLESRKRARQQAEREKRNREWTAVI